MATEADIIQRESGGDPYIGYGGVDLSKAPKDQYGFPIWEGRMGPQGISHAAGIYQFEPKTWAEGAQALGINDFSPGSQKQVYDYIRAKYGDKPWEASEPKLQPQGYYGGALHVNIRPQPEGPPKGQSFGIENALLASIVESRYPQEAQAPIGNKLLDGIVQNSIWGSPPAQQPQPQPAPKVTTQVPAAPPQNDFIEPPAKGQVVPVNPAPMPSVPAPAPGGATAPKAVPATPASPAPVPAPTAPPTAAKTGNDVLDRLLTMAGMVPGRRTDIQQAEADAAAAKAGPLPIFGAGGRIDELAHAIVPYIAGGAPGGAATAASGLRLPKLLKPPVVEEAQALDDDLFKMQQENQADMLQARNAVASMEEKNPDWLKPEFQEQAYHERESRMMTGDSSGVSPETTRFERQLSTLDDSIQQDAAWIREHAPDAAKEMPELATPEQGYVHRKVVGQPGPGERLDPAAQDIITGGGGRSLGRKAAGLMHRKPWYVIQNNAGRRVWGAGQLGEKGQPARYGETFTDPKTGQKWTVKAPTTAEIEARTPVRYVKNLLANTIDNQLRLSRVRRNIELLKKWKQRLYDKDFFLPDGTQRDIPKGFQRIELPQMRGWAPQHIADVLNEFYRTQRNDFLGYLDRANKFLIGTMFALPVRHIENVAAHYVVGRGFDNLYSSPQLARAVREVASQGPDYLRYLRAGAGLRYPSTLNENFYETLLSKMFHSQLQDPGWELTAKGLGMKVADLVKAEYAWSRRALWKVNDVFLTARIMELEGKGLPMEKAIQQAEKEIPNYRIPVEVMGTRFMSQFLKSPFVAFGRYGYGRMRAMSEMIKDMVGPNATGEERIHAIGQAAVMALLGTVGYKVANAGLNLALAKMGINQKPGAKPMEFAGAGPFGPMRAVMALAGLTKEERDLASTLSSFIVPAPGPQMIAEGLGGLKDIFTGQGLYDPYSSTGGKIIQGIESVGSRLYPVQLGIEAAKKGILPALGPSTLGIKQVYEGPPGRTKRYLERGAARREARDPIEKFLLGR